MASKAPTTSGGEAQGPFAKYRGHKVRMRRHGMLIKAVPQDEHSTTNAFGTDFPRGFWVPIGHLLPEYQAKLATNPGFVVSDTAPSGEPVIAPEDMYVGPIHGSGSVDNIPEYEDEGDFIRSAHANADIGADDETMSLTDD